MVALDHVALLVKSVEKSAERFAAMGLDIGGVDRFKETNEIYIGRDAKALPLLMEPAGPGAYQEALKERGPGIHHIAISVPELEKFILGLKGSGWYLHTNSLHTMKESRTVYLARPGFPLIEVQENTAEKIEKLAEQPPLISLIELGGSLKKDSMLNCLGLKELCFSKSETTYLTLGKNRISLTELVS